MPVAVENGWERSEPSAALVLADPEPLHLIARGVDLQALALDAEAELVANLRFKRRDLFVVELDDSVAVVADDVAVVGMIGVVGVVVGLVLAEIHRADQATFGQQRQRAVDCRSGHGFVPPPRPLQQLLRGEVLCGVENRVDDGLALAGHAQAFARKEAHELRFGGLFARRWHEITLFFRSRNFKPQSHSAPGQQIPLTHRRTWLFSRPLSIYG